MIQFRPSVKFDKAGTIVLVSQEDVNRGTLPRIANKDVRSAIAAAAASGTFDGKTEEIFPLVVGKRIVLLAGVGDADALSAAALRKLIRAAALSSYLKKAAEIEVLPHDDSDTVIRAVIEGLLIGTYKWDKYLTAKKTGVAADKKRYFLVAQSKRTHDEISEACAGVNLTRDLINDNADVVTSTHLEKTFRSLIKGHSRASIKVLNRKEMEREGLGLHLAVNQGSNKEPKLIIVKYAGGPAKEKYTAVLGKGITFDTGGLNLKPTGSMETMRCDMSGAAAVIGTLRNVLALRIKKNILFAAAIAENAIGPAAFKPGDVITGYAGKTVEIGNTDAEGRLVLADAISYLKKNYQPARIIDLATLTGACVIALGYDYSGLVSNNDDLARRLIRASNASDDRAWRLPSYPEIKEYVKSPIADIKNVGLERGAGGTITAAEFLRQFAEDTPWAHLDIAGTAFAGGKGPLHYAPGATGAGVLLLTEYLKTN